MAKIVILTLTDQRDKIVDERIARALRDKGHTVGVRNYAYAGTDAVRFEKPDLVVMPMVGSLQKLDFARRCHEWGVAVVVRRGEAGAAREVLTQMDPERQKVVVGDFDYAPHVDLELTWGPEFTEVLTERRGMTKERLVPCGAFTLDGCFQRARPARTGKKVLLFATAWSCADDDPAYTECGVATDSPLQGQLYRAHRQGRDQWLAAIKSLYMTKSHKYDFLLKVRPGERTQEYREKLGMFVRILPYEYPSADAIAMSDCVIHAGSTMAVEAHLLGVPSINFTNCNPDPRLAGVVPQCGDFAELCEVLGRMHWGHSNIDPAGYQWLVDHLYGKVDGHACDRAANAVHKLLMARKNAKTRIPDSWPHEFRYPTEGVSAQVGPNDHKMTCVSCKGEFGMRQDMDWGFCPYCGMSLRKVYVQMKKAV